MKLFDRCNTRVIIPLLVGTALGLLGRAICLAQTPNAYCGGNLSGCADPSQPCLPCGGPPDPPECTACSADPTDSFRRVPKPYKVCVTSSTSCNSQQVLCMKVVTYGQAGCTCDATDCEYYGWVTGCL